MIKYLTSISTAKTIVDMLQNEESIQNIRISIKTFDQGINQQGFTLFHHSSDVQFNLTEDNVTNEILIQVALLQNNINDTIIQDHRFDRDFDKAIVWLSKEIVKTFPNIWI